MNVIWLTTNYILTWCASSSGSAIGAAVYESVKKILDYVWFNAEEGYLKDFPEDEERENNSRTLVKRLKIVLGL